MMINNQSKGYKLGVDLINRINNGQFEKDHLPNHGTQFTGGAERMSLERFHQYLYSCTYYLITQRLEKEEYMYHE